MSSLWAEGVRGKEEETWGDPGLRVLMRLEIAKGKVYLRICCEAKPTQVPLPPVAFTPASFYVSDL